MTHSTTLWVHSYQSSSTLAAFSLFSPAIHLYSCTPRIANGRSTTNFLSSNCTNVLAYRNLNRVHWAEIKVLVGLHSSWRFWRRINSLPSAASRGALHPWCTPRPPSSEPTAQHLQISFTSSFISSSPLLTLTLCLLLMSMLVIIPG